MPFLKRHEIDPSLRSKHDKDWKAKLKQALVNPALTVDERREIREIREQLANVGKPKAYKADSPPKLGAFSFKD